MTLRLAAMLAFCVGAAALHPADSAPADRRLPVPAGRDGQVSPNILLILADDLGWSDLGAWGGEIPTPTLDELAGRGLMLTNFHANPTCSPSRASLLTGADHHRAGLGSMAELLTDNQRGHTGYEGHLRPDLPTLAERLRDAGYHTFMAGKWHLGSGAGQRPHDRGFEQSFALLEAGGSHFTTQGLSPMEPVAHYVENGKPAALPEGFFSTDSYTDHLIRFIDGARSDSRPFFAYAAFTAPHYPLQAPDAWLRRFEGRYDAGWDALREARWRRQVKLGLVPADAPPPPRDARVPAWASLPPDGRAGQARRMETYAAMVANLDHNVGRLLAYLENAGLRDRTVVVFLSDNGAEGVDYSMMPGFGRWFATQFDNRPQRIGRSGSYVFEGPGWAQVSNLPWRGYKGLETEGGTRVPAIIHDPRRAGRSGRSAALASIRDVLPTLLDLTGVAADDQAVAGRSLLPLLTSSAATVRSADTCLATELFGHKAVYRGAWKALSLAPPWGDGGWSLFNLVADPAESAPLRGEEHAAVATRLRRCFAAYADRYGVIDPPPGTVRYPMLPPLDAWQAD